MPLQRACPGSTLQRRQFLGLSGSMAIASLFGATRNISAQLAGSSAAVRTGNGEWTYETVPGWGQLPAGKDFGGTHGAIVTDNAGHLYVSTQSETGVLVYDRDGRLLRTIATQYPEIHSMVHVVEAGQEYFYATVQKGTPQENWLFLKMKPDGTVVQKITAPGEAGFHAPNEWKLTAAVPGPDGSIYIANGYGDSRIFKFDRKGNYQMAFAGKGDADGQCNCCHGMVLDTRYGQPLLLVCDRENRRLTHYDLDGKFVANLSQHLRRPCQVSLHGEFAVVSELEGRVTILDKDNTPVAFLGDNPERSQWANYELKPAAIAPAVFSAAHGCYIDRDATIYVSDWNQTGRVTKLVRA
jgi:DNA-binding beta-propeller fold protein YncE